MMLLTGEGVGGVLSTSFTSPLLMTIKSRQQMAMGCFFINQTIQTLYKGADKPPGCGGGGGGGGGGAAWARVAGV